MGKWVAEVMYCPRPEPRDQDWLVELKRDPVGEILDIYMSL